MATTAELLQGLIDSKAAIISALKNKGVTIADNAKFSDLPDIITNADIGGGGDAPSVPPHTIITYTYGTYSTTTEINIGDDGILTWEMTKGAGNQYATNTTIHSVEIGSGVTSIEDFAFYCCESLTSVTIPSSVTSIGEYAFYDCSSLTSVTIPEGVTSIGEHAFNNCPGLTNIILENRTLEEAQSLIGTTNNIGYTGTVTYNGGGTYTTDAVFSPGAGD